MTAKHMKKTLPLAVVTATIMMLAGATCAQARPVKLVPSSDITAGFQYPESVAFAPGGNIYVADRGNTRVQELTATGEFVLMFGKEVNETTKGDICTEEEITKSAVKCKAGVEGSAAGAFNGNQGVAVDPSTGNVYVQDFFNWRVDEYTAAGQFVLMFGKEVNETTKGNICTEEEITKSAVKCKAGVRGGTEHGEFDFAHFAGNLLAVGGAGPNHLLYVGDQGRVQELEADGAWVRGIAIACTVGALAVDETGDVYAVCSNPISSEVNVVQEFNPSGVEIHSFTVSPRQPGNEVAITAIALDSEGHLAVSAAETESNQGAFIGPFGSLYAAGTGKLITRFTSPGVYAGMAFNGKNELYAAGSFKVLVYKPLNVAELMPGVVSCVPGVEEETDVTLDCSLKGEVNPWGVPGTEVWFEWGRTASLGNKTPVQSIKEPPGEVSLPLSAEVPAVRPNEPGFYYQLAGYDANSPSSEGEALSSEAVSFTTPMTAPRIVGVPSAPFVRSSSAVMLAELNPENANTTYEFQYGACENLEACPTGTQTGVLKSAQYGKVGATQEVVGLQPATTYRYRLLAESENLQKTEKLAATGPEGSFTTAPAPVPQATTGTPSLTGATTATISGTVNPDGQPATYTFELGVYAGAQTQYGIVFSGPAGTGVVPVTKTLGLSGLQPGTTYAYRITVSSGYGTATGETMTFTTAGLPEVLLSPTPLAMLAIPSIAFPAAVTSKSTTKALTNAQKLAKALTACKKKAKKQRAACKKQARKKYAKSKQANDRKKR
jgi:NHL repeat